MHDIGNLEAAAKLAEEASESYFELVGVDGFKTATSPSDADFERIVPLWSR